MGRQASKLPSSTSPSSVTTGSYLSTTWFHMESIFQADDRQAGSGKTNLPKDQEAGHLHVQLLIRRPGRSNGCRTQQVQRHVFRVWGYLKILRRKKLLTLHSGVERSWGSISGWFKDVPHEHREHVRQPHPHLPQQDDEHLLWDLVRHQDQLWVGFISLYSQNFILHLRCLNTLEVYVDNIFVVNRQMTLDQATQETFNPPWPSLKSLKLGGMVRITSVCCVWKASHASFIRWQLDLCWSTSLKVVWTSGFSATVSTKTR